MPVNTWFWVRAFVMFLGLIATVIGIRQLDRTKKAAAVDEAKIVNLCPTRVSAVKLMDGTLIAQEKMSWFRSKGGQSEELDPIAVEKWFGRNCRVEIAAEAATDAGPPAVEFQFVSGQPETIFSTGNGLYMWQSRVFRSPALETALNELQQLPLRLRPSR